MATWKQFATCRLLLLLIINGCMLHTYTLLRNRRSGQADDYNYDTGDGEKDDGKIQIMDIGDDCRLLTLLATSGSFVSELEDHANDSHHESNHQTPKRTLQNGGNTNSSENHEGATQHISHASNNKCNHGFGRLLQTHRIQNHNNEFICCCLERPTDNLT